MENNNLKQIDIAGKIVNILDSKKAQNIKLLKVTDQTIIADYFVICTGNSNTQMKALADEVEYKLGLDGVKPQSIEGASEALWIVLDYSCVIVHIFNKETREFFKLEKLWCDAEDIDISKYIQVEKEDDNE